MTTEDPLEQSLLELRVLQRVAEDVTSALDLDEILARCVATSSEVAHTSSCAIYLRDERRSVFRRRIARETLNDQTYLPTAQIDAWLAHQSSVMVNLHDPAIAMHPGVLASRARGFTATLNMAMRWHGRLIGLLILAFRDRVTMPESTLRTLEAIIGYQAAAIENARAHQAIERRARLALMLREFSERTISISDSDVLHRVILDTALALSGADRGLISRVDGQRTLVFAGVGCCATLVGQSVPLSDRYVAESLEKSEPVVFEDVATMDAMSPIAAAAQRHKTAQLMILTMRHDETPLGQLLLGTAAARDWEGEEIEAMRTLASMAAELMERVRIQAARELERRRLGESIEHLPIGVVVLDHSGKAIHINRAARALATQLGVTSDNWRQTLLSLRVGGAALAPGDTVVMRALRGEHPPPHDVQITSVNGDQQLTLRGAAAPLLELDGSVRAVVVGFQDVTELKDLADAKERFLRIASHELRSPITSLRATTQLLTLDPTALADPGRRSLMLTRLDRQSLRLVNFVNQLLDTTHLQTEQLPLQLGDCDLVSICRQAAETADRRVIVEADGAIVGRWDALRLEQVLTNLVVNALRYSPPESSVIVRVRQEDQRAILQVIDRGIGIPPTEMDRVFTPFFRSPSASSQHRSGLGLGLHITREIVRRHGGSIEVASQTNLGSTFTVQLPLAGPSS